MNENERRKYLQKHLNKIYQGSDGYWYTYVPTSNYKSRIKLKKASEEELKKNIAEYYDSLEKRPYFPETFQWWIDDRMSHGELENSTYTKYTNIFLRFFSADNPFCKIRLCDVTDQDVEEFLRGHLAGRKLCKKSFNDLKTVLNGVFKYAKQKHYTTFSISTFFSDYVVPTRMFKPADKKEDSEDVFDSCETEKISQWLWEKRSAADLALLLMFQTGMRVGEASGLRQSDIGPESVFVNGTETTYKDWKTGKRVTTYKKSGKSEAATREILIPEQAKTTLMAAVALNPKGPYLFMKNGRRITTKMLNYRLHVACKAVKVPERSTHKIRKTYASLLVANQLDERLIIRQMGHTDISTTMKFYVRDRESRLEHINEISDVVRIGSDIEKNASH